MKNPWILKLGLTALLPLVAIPKVAHGQMSKVKTVWVILMENHKLWRPGGYSAWPAPNIYRSAFGKAL